MRLRELLAGIGAGRIKHIVSGDGVSRRRRRADAAQARRSFSGPKRMKPKNWDRDKRKRRKEQKRRRKQRWR